MKQPFLFAFIIVLIINSVYAQQKIEPGGMNYILAAKTNSIFFRDTLYSGSKQFEQLFYRTKDRELIQQVERHQSNKIAGQILGIVGTFATIFGLSKVSSSGSENGYGWALVGGGFAVSLTGGFLTIMGQRNLQMAVTLFNKKYHQAALGFGISKNTAGLVYKF